MAKYRVIAASVNIHAGVLGLEPHQAQARLHRVQHLGGNRYDVLNVSFKRGEEFEYEGELPKHLVECVAESVASCPVPEAHFPPIEPDLVTDFVPDDGVAEPPPDQSPQDRVTVFVTDLVESVPDVAEPPPKRKKGARAEKPAA